MIWKLKLLELGGNGVIFILHDFNRIKCVYGFPQSWFCFRNTYFSSFIPRINESTERLWCSVFYAFLLPNRLKICPCLNKQPGTRDNCRKSTVKNITIWGAFVVITVQYLFNMVKNDILSTYILRVNFKIITSTIYQTLYIVSWDC